MTTTPQPCALCTSPATDYFSDTRQHMCTEHYTVHVADRQLEQAARNLELAKADLYAVIADQRRRGRTVRAIARAAHVSHQTVANIERREAQA